MTELLDISAAKKPKPKERRRALIPTKIYNCLSCGKEEQQHGLSTISARLLMMKICPRCAADEKLLRDEARAMARAGRLPSGQKRWVALVLATPEWRDREAIAQIYQEAKQWTEATGVKHEVDHIYPIQSEFGCGLHVHQNLRIINKFENRSKGNKFPLHDSPALK